MSYIVRYVDSVLSDDLPSLPKSAKDIIKRAIEARLTTAPQQYGKPLRYAWAGHRRLRVADYRVIYRIDEPNKTVYVVAIGIRRDIYED